MTSQQLRGRATIHRTIHLNRLLLGEAAGHPFRGNQYTDGGGDDPLVRETARQIAEGRQPGAEPPWMAAHRATIERGKAADAAEAAEAAAPLRSEWETRGETGGKVTVGKLGETRGGKHANVPLPPGVAIHTRSELDDLYQHGAGSWDPDDHNTAAFRVLTESERAAVATAPVAAVFDYRTTGHLGAPVKWKAPNGVTVFYDRAQRRSQAAEKSGEGAGAVFHDFGVGEGREKVIPLTEDEGEGVAALQAWMKAQAGSTVTERWRARQMVRPGD